MTAIPLRLPKGDGPVFCHSHENTCVRVIRPFCPWETTQQWERCVFVRMPYFLYCCQTMHVYEKLSHYSNFVHWRKKLSHYTNFLQYPLHIGVSISCMYSACFNCTFPSVGYIPWTKWCSHTVLHEYFFIPLGYILVKLAV